MNISLHTIKRSASKFFYVLSPKSIVSNLNLKHQYTQNSYSSPLEDWEHNNIYVASFGGWEKDPSDEDFQIAIWFQAAATEIDGLTTPRVPFPRVFQGKSTHN